MSYDNDPPGRRRGWLAAWRAGPPAVPQPAPAAADPAAVPVWRVDGDGLVDGVAWWRAVCLDAQGWRRLATAVRTRTPFSGLRAQLRHGPHAGRVAELAGCPAGDGWSGVALPLDEPWVGGLATGGRRGSELVQAVLDQAAAMVGADHLFVARTDGEHWLVPEFAADLPGADDLTGQPYRSGGTACGDVLARRRPLVVPERLDERYPLFGRFRRLNVGAYAGAPLFEGGRAATGVVAAVKVGRFDEPERVQAVLAAAARLIEPELALAVTERDLGRDICRLDSVLNHLPAMAYRIRMSTDGRRRLLYVSAGAERLVGVPAGELQQYSPERLLELRHPEDREMSLARTLALLQEGKPVEVRWRLVRPDGGVRWVLARETLAWRDGADLVVDGLLLDFTAETEERQALALRERELRAVADYTPDWESWLDGDGSLRWVNPGVEQVTGYSPAECRELADYPRAFVLDDDRVAFDRAMAAARDGEAVLDHDIRIRRRWSKPVWCSLSIQPVMVAGAPAGLRVSIRRIDRRKRAEQALQQREGEIARVLAALDLVREGVLVTDAEGRVSYCNQAAATVLGHPDPAGVRGRFWRELGLAGSAAAPFLDVIENSLASRGIWRGEMMLGQGDAAVYLDTRFTRLPEDGFIAVLTDIGVRKRADEQIRENEERYRALFETAGDAIFLLEGSSIVDANPRAEALFGIGRDELQGRGLHDFSPPAQPDGRDSAVAAADLLGKALAGKPQAYEWLGRHQDGALVNLEVSLTGVPRRGRPYLVAVARDVTERRRREEESRRLEAQLQQARKLEALGQLAGGVAHDFNNILGAIRGFADLLAEECAEGTPSARYVSRILTASDRAKGMVRQILTFTRRNELSRSTFDLRQMAEECDGLLRASIPSTTRISLDIGPAEAPIEGDRDQLAQVVLNLVINANDALDGNPGNVRVAIAPTEPDEMLLRLAHHRRPDLAVAVEVLPQAEGGLVAVTGSFDPARRHVTLAVADDGPGIPVAVAERAFDPFFTTKKVGKGTGLGLAVVHSIVLAHGGAVVLRTGPNGGTRFEVVLPLADAAPEAEAAAPAAPAQLPAKARVLLVDDDIDFGDMLLAALEKRGAEAAAVSSPVEALEVFRDEPGAWDALVTDQTMPEMRGVDLVKAVKAIRPDLPCLICTGYAESLDEAALSEAGVFALAHKPVDLAAFFTLLGRALAG